MVYENGIQKLLLTEEGYVDLSDGKYYYYLKDHQGNNRVVLSSSGTVQEMNHYYPFGGLFASTSNVQPYKYNGKELDTKKGLNWYDYGTRHYDAMLGRWFVVDPLAEKYCSSSPFAYCGNNPINRIDLFGMDWYQNNETKYYVWYDDNTEREGYTYVGGQGSVLGEFEPIINNLLINVYGVGSMYQSGFSFDIAPTDKGGFIGSKERDWDLLDEFIAGIGPEISVFLSNHPYTKDMKTDDYVQKGQQAIVENKTEIPGQITSVEGKWGIWDVPITFSAAKQFIGTYRYDAFTSKDGKYLNNVVSDSNSRYSFFYHLYPSRWNKKRSQQKILSNTYQFYIWQSKK